MGTEIVPFDFEGHSVRPVDGREELIAKDVCDVLGLGNITNALRGLDPDEITNCKVVDSAGREQEMKALTFPGVYRLTCKSRKPVARRFARWVFHDVLPSIQKTGGYVAPGHEEQFLAALTAMTAEVKALREWKDKTEAAHPFGLMGRRDAKVLSGQMCEIRNLLQRNGDERKPRALLLIVDRSIRLQAGYPKDKGAKWELATATQATIAFSRASQWISALRKDAPPTPPVNTSQVPIDFAAEKSKRA